MASRPVARVFGGSPISVIGYLVLLSIIVGGVLQTVELDPLSTLKSIEVTARQFYDLFLNAVRYVWQYFLLGAAVVVPVWVVLRLFRFARR